MPNTVQDVVVRRYFEDENGAVVFLSDDLVFIRALRNIVTRIIGVTGDVLHQYTSPNAAVEKCLELYGQGVSGVLFIERKLDGKPTTDVIIRLKREIPDLKIILLTWEATQESVAYLFELGVGKVLVKPASANRVIEELADVISPPTELKRLVDRCRSLLGDNNFDEALSVSDRILLLKPDSAKGLVMRGDSLMGIGEVDKAVRSYITAHEAKPIYMAPLVKLAAAFREMDDERALSYLKILDDISPLNPERKIDIAEEYLRRNETEEAEAYLDRGMEVAERETLSMVGDLTERIVDAVSGVAPNLAIKYLNRVLGARRVLGRDDLVHFNRLGIILRGEGQWREAVAVYEKALTIAPDDPVVHYNMGLAYWEGDERMRGLKAFERALSLAPRFYVGSVGTALNIGSLYLDLREYDQARPFFEHVLEIEPGNEAAAKRLEAVRSRKAPRAKGAAAGRDSDYAVDAVARGGKAKSGSRKKGGGIPIKLD